ncbi:MAG: dihydroorotate dehydrogenase electron transfer subunit [Moorella humiferrea]|uniref:Dihydroorotate dehydrogenase B, electron transfer subunit n=1 Tax=Neomoorella humiferrea TaxID=676965 RepID=A0A2T0AJU6_9FIRM|nr:dihydroorotate dehydrogenase electron transfer subunit [Moorella humiferrea]MBE3572057.1 dihydroorotate dehydrogenase electron transfer subunit [Moorella humiferrea]PRR68684.1 Dihydroorotate dehydrogenase B, electron transfer subunit [Moorella humiferrea]
MYVKGKIVDHKQVDVEHRLIIIEQEEIARQARPGQFIMLRAWERRDIVLPRPFSLYRILPEKGQLQILYKIRGKATMEIANRKPGEEVAIIGPLGRGVTLPERGNIALLGRGIGAAPLMAIGEAAYSRGLGVYTFLSAKKKDLIPGLNDFERVAQKVTLSTDDGEINEGRLLTFLLEDLITAEGVEINIVFTCGSRRLAKGLYSMEQKYNFTAYVLLEEIMACGIGSCKGCVCKVKNPDTPEGFVYKRVCQEGPVFPVSEVIW